MRQMLKRLTFPLRVTLVSAVIAAASLVIAIGVGSIGIPAFSKAKTAIRNLWADIAKQVAETSTQKVVRYFQSAPITLRFITGLIEEKQLGLGDLETVLDICYRAIKANPDFMTVYYSKNDGSLYGVFKIGDDYLGSYRTVEADGKTKVRNYKIGPENLWVLQNEETSDYDPRKRPFWKTGEQNRDGGWTEPYQFVTTKATGYTYVLEQKNEGYWAVDFQIDKLTDYLQSLDVGEGGIVYIVANDGTRIAASTPKTSTPEAKKEAAGQDQLVNQAWAKYVHSDASGGFLQVEHKIFYVNRFPKDLGIPWNLVTIIHENDYLIPIQKEAYNSLKEGLIPCAVFLGLSTLFFGYISRRLKSIASEMDEVGNLSIEFKPQNYRYSRIREVNIMNESLFKMKIGLQSFSKYVPVNLIKELLQSGKSAKLGGEKKEVSILFADMAHFTTLAEELEPNEVVKIIEEFFTTASNEIHKEKGIVDKFMGDAVMALWGGLSPMQDSAVASCRTALAMKRFGSTHPRMNHRIGINTGNAMVGNFGSEERMDFTAIGDAVNIAARLERLNKRYGTQILVGPDTAKSAGEAMLFRPLDWVLLQGRTKALLVYELLREKEGAANTLIEAASTYGCGLEAYRNRKFAEATGLFEKANHLFGGVDIPSTILIERCRAYEKKPLPQNWNGTAIFDENAQHIEFRH